MKYIVLLCDGMSDLPCAELGGKTPMTVAKKPNMDALARVSQVGMVKTVPEHLPPGSDVANLSVLGYDPSEYYSGRSPLEAASMGIDMGSDDLAVRCNLVRLSDAERFEDATMLSYCADDIHTEKASELILAADKEFGNESFKFYPGISYRHCLICKGGTSRGITGVVPPHDITGRKIADYIKKTPQNRELVEIMEKSYRLLRGKQANCLWFWGEGKKSTLPLFKDKFGINASLISAVDLLKGIGILTKMDVIHVPGATGYIDTDFSGKAQAAIKSLSKANEVDGVKLVYIHMEAPDECGHRGEVANKVKSIELIDELVLGKLLEAFRDEEISILIAPDHPTPLELKTHTRDAVPFLMYNSAVKRSGVEVFDEKNAESTGVYIGKGHELMEKFLCQECQV
ncbi:MAG: cofactor-independent phosphoglycerate mutase [Oscillospiraceae bacterium]|nr:cofactor-independent phosphoglycerate mutase [Oscillospiraceae bacterium]